MADPIMPDSALSSALRAAEAGFADVSPQLKFHLFREAADEVFKDRHTANRVMLSPAYPPERIGRNLWKAPTTIRHMMGNRKYAEKVLKEWAASLSNAHG